MKTRFINKIALDKKHFPPKWMENLVSNGKFGGVMLVFVEGFTEKEIAYKTKAIKEFCKTLKEGGGENMDEKAFSNEEIHNLRKEIDAITSKVRRLADMRPREGGAELTLSFRSLQLGKMWLGKVLEEAGSELPAEFADKA